MLIVTDLWSTVYFSVPKSIERMEHEQNRRQMKSHRICSNKWIVSAGLCSAFRIKAAPNKRDAQVHVACDAAVNILYTM